MKSKILALLLCFVLVASLFLMSACSFGKKSSGEDAGTEVADEQAREVAMGSFLKGIEAIRKGGIVFTGTLKGTSTEKDETGAPKTESIDLTLTLNYSNETFDAVAEGTAGGDSGKFEFYFDGETVGMLSTEGDKSEGDVYFVDDFAEDVPEALSGLFASGEEYTEFVDQLMALIDFDKVAANISSATKDVVSIKIDGKTYVVSVSSDAIFDAATAIVNTVKDSGDKTVAELFDALVGEGSFAKLQETLQKYSGTDTLDTLIPDLEATLADLGIKVDAAYAFAAETMGLTGDDAVDQLKALINGKLSDMTINDAIAMVSGLFGGSGKAEQYQMAVPGSVGTTGETDGEESGMTYEAIVAMVAGYSQMKVNALLGSITGNPTFDIAETVAPALDYIAAFKEAIKFKVSVTCDSKLNPTKIKLTASIDTTKLPEDMQEEGEVTQIELSISAEVKSVTVAPSAAMAAKIADEKAKREADTEEQG